MSCVILFGPLVVALLKVQSLDSLIVTVHDPSKLPNRTSLTFRAVSPPREDRGNARNFSAAFKGLADVEVEGWGVQLGATLGFGSLGFRA